MDVSTDSTTLDHEASTLAGWFKDYPTSALSWLLALNLQGDAPTTADVGEGWSRAMAKACGVLIIVGACLNKLPVIRNIQHSKSTEGLSKLTVYGETLMFSLGFFYGLLEDYPLTAYGENVALLVQSIAIIFFMWKYADTHSNSNSNEATRTASTASLTAAAVRERRFVVAFAVAYSTFVLYFLPLQYRFLLTTAVWPLLIFSQGSQIVATIKVKHTGAQSIATISLNLIGCIVRILTTIAEVGWDFAFMGGFAIGAFLYLVLLVQYFYYQPNTREWHKQQQQASWSLADLDHPLIPQDDDDDDDDDDNQIARVDPETQTQSSSPSRNSGQLRTRVRPSSNVSIGSLLAA